jgi:hypothetical protein
MRKFTKASILSLIDDEAVALPSPVSVWPPKFDRTGDLTFTSTSLTLCDDILDCIFQLKSELSRERASRTLVELLEDSQPDYFSLRSSGLLGKLISAIGTVSAPTLSVQLRLARVLVLLASDESNLAYFDLSCARTVFALLGSSSDPAAELGLELLGRIGSQMSRETEVPNGVVTNLESSCASRNDFHGLIAIGEGFSSSLRPISAASFLRMLDRGSLRLVVDAIHKRRTLALDDGLRAAILDLFFDIEETKQLEMWLAAVCNILEVNQAFAGEVAQRHPIVARLEEICLDRSLSACYSAFVLGSLKVSGSKGIGICPKTISSRLEMWLKGERNQNVRSCIEAVLSRIGT